MSKYLASVIIPVYGREFELLRAVESVIRQKNSHRVEIIIVDDSSDPPVSCKALRPTDKIIRHPSNKGAAAARNSGIIESQGELIYFLDSDDWFIDRDFVEDHKFILGKENVFYCDYRSNGVFTDFPSRINPQDYFFSIFYRHHGICNTCTMVYSSHLNILFDPTLPKHEDWDFVYSNFVRKGLSLIKVPGSSYIDRSDKRSLSRSPNILKEYFWLNKLSFLLDQDEMDYVRFAILCKYTQEITWRDFLIFSLYYLIKGKASLSIIAKRLIQRFII